MDLDEFNGASRDDALAWVRPCADIPRWVDDVVGGRPYPTPDALLSRARAAAREWTIADADLALSSHPRIGERPAGSSAEATLSRSEQPAVATGIAQALADGNREYETRFGRIFLIRAKGRSAEEIVECLHRRLEHTPADEEPVVVDELREIALLRLEGLIDS